MPAPLDLQSELFSATGGAAAEGVSNQLGRPRVDRFTLLVREAVQNSWDARLVSSGGVQFTIDGYHLDRNARNALAEKVYTNVPFSVGIREQLLGDIDFSIIAISDFGTRGLGGPTRGDVVPQPGEATNFVDFMRYIGRPPNREYGGGTYGFGKAAYFLASSLRAICVHTRFSNGQELDSRFMAAALGPQFETNGPNGRRFTGRHWWGRLAQDDVVDPAVGIDADALASLLGVNDRGPDATGTTIYVLAPDFEGVAPQKVLLRMGRAVMDYFWPKLIDGPNLSPTMSFKVRWQGVDVPLPNLQDDPELSLLARAFVAATSEHAVDDVVQETVFSQRPKRLLGRLALIRQPVAVPGPLPGIDEEEPDNAGLRQRELRRPLRQIALMRAPNFVVKYMQGPPIPYELGEYAGVFRVDADVDAAFARAEPPTHDDWVPDLLLDASEKTYVRVALRRISTSLDTFTSAPAIEVSGGSEQSVSDFARLLGGLVPSLSTGGASPSRQRPANPGGRSRGDGNKGGGGVDARQPQVAFVGEANIEMIDDIPAMIAHFEVVGSENSSVRIYAVPKVVISEGFESDPPHGSYQPQVLRWMSPDGVVAVVDSTMCEIPVNSGTWSVAISIPPDAMISVSLGIELPVDE
jgi:hypothetical protein